MTDPGEGTTNPPPTHTPPPSPAPPRPVVIQQTDNSGLLEVLHALPEKIVDGLREATKAEPAPTDNVSQPDPANPAATTNTDPPASISKPGNRFHRWWFRK